MSVVGAVLILVGGGLALAWVMDLVSNASSDSEFKGKWGGR